MPTSALGPSRPTLHLPLLDEDQEEFDSPETIEALADVLRSFGHDVDLLGEGEPMLRRLLDGPRPDLVLNFAEGQGIGRSREARVPAVLEMLGVPYTGSDPLTLAVTLDKDCAKRLVTAAGVATPRWTLVRDGESFDAVAPVFAGLTPPLIVKPAYEGSSKGVRSTSLIHRREDLPAALTLARQTYRQPVLVEEFIDGNELTVGMVGNQPPEILGVMRILPRQADGPFLYSLEVKRDFERLVRYECPAQLSAADTRAVRHAAFAAWQALGCRDVARLDFRLRNHVPYFLEANPLPGLSPKSGDLVIMARLVGVEYPELIRRILETALRRLQMADAPSAPRRGGRRSRLPTGATV
ncbi:MAG: D-alanine--D-alanine ligase [Planctomycetes bacterium]|nr:D-alanine--D-alanine ligase [Planctomycetota bacterium]